MRDQAATTDIQDGGQTISGRYRIDECIGDGGTSTVYRGHDLLLDRRVAIKRLSAPLLREPSQSSLFLNEARLTATLSHPGIVMLHDAVEEDGERYLIMEYVEGANLRSHLALGPIHPAAAVELADQVGEALAYAHRHNIVHGDVKPENILLAADGRPRLLDFGVARLTPEAEPSSSVTHGTAAYAAPEVLEGRTPTLASDVYSLGAVLHEMLTGRLPHEMREPDAETASPDSGPIPTATEMYAEVPATLEAVVARATHRDALCRFQSVQEFLHTLHAYQRGDLLPPADRLESRLPQPALHWDAGTTQRVVLAVPLALGVILGLVAIIAWGRHLAASSRPMDIFPEIDATTSPFSVQLPPALLTPMETVIAGPEPLAPVVDRSNSPTADPFQFCAIVGTTDTPTEGDFGPVEYIGPAQPFPGHAWRCWNGLVLGCEGGPRVAACMKVSGSRTPTAALTEYCRANPESEPPLSVMGQTTVYDWSCQRGRPLIARQRISDQQIDGFGYRIGPWYTLSAP